MREEPRADGGASTWLIGMAFFGLLTVLASALDAGLFILIPLVPALLMALLVLAGLVETVATWLRRWRASRGRVARTLHGHAVGRGRWVSGNRLRTMVIDDGGPRYAHLLFPVSADDELIEPGAVELDLFTDRTPAGPVRLRQGDVVLWASAVRIGRTAELDPAAADLTWSGDDGWDGGSRWEPGGDSADADGDQDAGDD